ncbi:MAG: 4-hydroxy-tetrahydrodipicolinate reductase [Kiritimatiellaeota bacterium]|nr:4-hydroxy-tetrahydrodipicolinate reductase [Kiritimatiellota bacterium]
MIRVIVAGAAGRMGKRLVDCVISARDMELAGATEHAESPMLGLDAGTIAGAGESGIAISAEMDAFVGSADCVMDFSTGDIIANAKTAVSNGLSVVIGTTALDDGRKGELAKLADAGGRIVLAPNMSVGVNVLFYLAEKTAELLGDGYDIEIVEMHHNQKRDAPSGTAVRLGECVAKGRNLSYKDDAVHCREGMVGARKPTEIGMHAVRGGDVVGDHTVVFATQGERVELVHKASSRDTFAMGALKAARFLAVAAPGFYDMRDVLGL